jgi:hypothetical protein
MTIAQDKYCYTDTNPDGSHTIKGILEFTDLDGNDTACIFRFHLESKTGVISQLVYLTCSWETQDNLVPNLIWKQYLEPTGISPNDIQWLNHRGTFSGHNGRVDIRRPYQDIDPETQQRNDAYKPVLIEWTGSKFEYSNPNEVRGQIFYDKSLLPVPALYLGTVEEVADKFNWRKGINRLDSEHRVDQINNDGSKTIKTIYRWEHPDYPSHCLLRILLHPKKAIIMMSSLKSNIPPHQSYRNKSINSLYECLIQVVNGIFKKYNYELCKYQQENTIWIYEWGDFSSTPYDWTDVWSVTSYFELVNLVWNGSTLNYLYLEEDEDNDNCTSIENKAQIDFFRSSRFGTVEESLDELGWFNH